MFKPNLFPIELLPSLCLVNCYVLLSSLVVSNFLLVTPTQTSCLFACSTLCVPGYDVFIYLSLFISHLCVTFLILQPSPSQPPKHLTTVVCPSVNVPKFPRRVFSSTQNI